MQISLTGRGTNNKKNEKMSLISLTMFKLITRKLNFYYNIINLYIVKNTLLLLLILYIG